MASLKYQGNCIPIKNRTGKNLERLLMIGTAFDCLAVDSLLLTTEVNESVRIDMTANNLRHTILKILPPPPRCSSVSDSIISWILANFYNNVKIFCNFNADLCTCSYSFSVNEFIDTFVCACFDSLINIPTRVTIDSQPCLDHIYVKSSLQYKSVVVKFDISHHLATYWSFSQMLSPTLNFELVYFRDDSNH